MKIKAISLWQPWASFIAFGLKKHETRSWSTPYRGLLAIHAAKRWTFNERVYYDRICHQFPEVASTMHCHTFQPPLGVMLCVCRLVDVSETQFGYSPSLSLLSGRTLELAVGDWTPGRYAWKLEVVHVFEQPIPATGRQQLWDWELPEGVKIE